MPDGAYQLRVDAEDATGAVAHAQAPVTVDGTGPTVSLASPAQIGPEDAVTVQIADAGSGVAQGTIETEDDTTDVTAAGSIAVAAPYDGWADGANSISVDVSDKAGNTTVKSLSFNVREPPGPAPETFKNQF